MTCIVYKYYNIFVKYVLVKNMKDSLNQSLKR